MNFSLWRIIITVTVACGFAQDAAATMVQKKYGNVEAAIWLPLSQPGRPSPLLIISHGLNGCYNNSFNDFAEVLTEHNYIVAAPKHEDGKCSKDETEMPKADNFFRPETWTAQNFKGRAEDVRTVLKGMKTDIDLQWRVNFKHVGLVGLSMGGYTAIGIGEKRWGWSLPGLKAIVGVSPHCTPYSSQHLMGKLHVPILFAQGAHDAISTPYVEELNGCYAQANAPKYLVEIRDAGHSPWSGKDGEQVSLLMEYYVIAFLDAEVKGKEDKLEQLIQAKEGVTELWYDSGTSSDHFSSVELPVKKATGKMRKAKADQPKG